LQHAPEAQRCSEPITYRRFSLHDGGEEDDASCDPLYDDPLDAFFYGVNRAQEPPKYILQN
jgi:hypothetical protein